VPYLIATEGVNGHVSCDALMRKTKNGTPIKYAGPGFAFSLELSNPGGLGVKLWARDKDEVTFSIKDVEVPTEKYSQSFVDAVIEFCADRVLAFLRMNTGSAPGSECGYIRMRSIQTEGMSDLRDGIWGCTENGTPIFCIQPLDEASDDDESNDFWTAVRRNIKERDYHIVPCNSKGVGIKKKDKQGRSYWGTGDLLVRITPPSDKLEDDQPTEDCDDAI
jgi:hypothetical protein